MSRFFVRFFLSRSPKKLHRGTLLCFTKFLVSKNFMEKRGEEEEERGSIKILRQFFLVSLPKKFVGEPFIVSLISGIEKCYACEGYVMYFCRNFLSRTIEKLRRGPLRCFTKFLVPKGLWKRGGRGGRPYHDFPSVLSCHIAEKIRGGTLYCVTDFGYRKMLCLRGLCHDFLSKVFCLAVTKNFVGEISVVHKNSVIEKLHGKEGGG